MRGETGGREGAWPLGGVLRDITRGGIAGLVVGLVVGGIGGRVAMRLAAIAVPEATGAFTENGNRIGAITVDGSVALIAFAGLFVGLISGVLWVTVERWIPGGTGVRALLAMPVAVALGSFVLIKGTNVDFLVLQHQPVVIGTPAWPGDACRSLDRARRCLARPSPASGERPDPDAGRHLCGGDADRPAARRAW